jgi:paraquat-inducible protein A
MTESLILTCHHCGACYRRVVLQKGEWARCSRCDEVLETYGVFTSSAWLALILTALVSFTLANVFTIATLSFQGSSQATTFLQAAAATWHDGYEEVAILTGLVGFGLPLLQLTILTWIFVPLALNRLPLGFEAALTVLGWVKPWSMLPVFMVGSLVAIVKLVDLADLSVGVGLFATGATTILLTGLGKLSPRKIRHLAFDAGLPVAQPEPEPAPSPACLTRAWALLLAAAILYIPANALPIMIINAIGSDSGHTIIGGVIELAQMGSWDIAAVVFIASVFVPLFKLILLAVLLWLTQRRSAQGLKRRTKLYLLVEMIGQWSMLDVFVVILLASLGQFGALLSIEPGAGAVAFGAVVVLTMLAAMSFDSRLAWRFAGHRRWVRPADATPTPT